MKSLKAVLWLLVGLALGVVFLLGAFLYARQNLRQGARAPPVVPGATG